MENNLFGGDPSPFGGLSNERELAKCCPPKFNNNNEWSDYAMKLFFKGGDISDWDWKTDNKETASKQLRCFKGLISTFDLPHEDKEAVAGWMLSEMLTDVPVYKDAAKRG